uniref:Uncharacterized protein n=1 Tax=Kalanchoe fedtschenkoi TaxID=63787 RepID=A0A7N0VFR9_KALFE
MEMSGEQVKKDEPEINYRGIKAMPLIIGNETCEKLGTIGTSTNLLVYLTTVFNMGSIQATNLVNIFNGTANFATLIGAYLCDTYFGRYNTLGFASISSFLGMVVITLTAAVSKLHPPHSGAELAGACVGPSAWQMAFLVSGLAFLVVGAGGIRPCNLAFGADQFNPNTGSGKRGISSFFNWYYFTFTFAMMVSLTVVVYVQADVSWSVGLAIPTALMFLSCAFFFAGTRIYVKVRPEGTPLRGAAQVLAAAFKKRKLETPAHPQATLYNWEPESSINSKLPHTNQFRCLDKAAIVTAEDKLNPDGSLASDPWRLSSMQKVEEVKCVLRIFPIWATFIVYFAALVLQTTYAVFQALQSDRRLGKGFEVPGASYSVVIMIAMTIWIPIYDQVIVPALRKYTKQEGGMTLLKKIGIGMALTIVCTLVSGLVETKRRTVALTKPTLGLDSKGHAISSFSALWLVPQLALAGVSEAFTSIGHIEFYYKQFPENMRSIGGSFTFVGMALGSYLCTILVTLVDGATRGSGSESWLAEDLNKGRLDYFYYVMGLIGVINLGFFLVLAKWYRYKGSSSRDELVELSVQKPFEP